ncbi:MAG: AAA family ATPase [Tunicatimonas sp.]
MIHKVSITNFKRFEQQDFELKGNVVLAGPNNSGKSTLLQAIAVWNLALREWHQERSGSKATVRTGVQLPRSKFTAIPLREMKLLWNDTATAKRKNELNENEKLGTPRPLEIRVSGVKNDEEYLVGISFTYRFPDLVLIKPTDDTDTDNIEWLMANFSLLFVPSFSGIGINETRYDQPYQEMLIGSGKPGDILRNRMLDVWTNVPDKWKQLVKDIQDIFGYTLLPPQYDGQPYIICDYVPGIVNGRPKSSQPVLDIASAGSGFLQTVLLLSFFYSKNSGTVLFDEPDAHLHIVLQRQVYDKVRAVAQQTKSQLIIATHSEVVIDNTAPDHVLSFYRQPHRLGEKYEAERVRAALRNLSSMDILQADRWPAILYLEGGSDFNLLSEWSRVLDHPLKKYFEDQDKSLFWHNNVGRNPKQAKEHLFALKAIKPEMRGVLLLDGDGRNLPDHELRSDGLEVTRWNRYEAENYLLVPSVLERFIYGGDQMELFGRGGSEKVSTMRNYIAKTPFLSVLDTPYQDDEATVNIGASKKFLPGLFNKLDIPLSKNEYYSIARVMKPDEIHPEIKEKLDLIYKVLVM